MAKYYFGENEIDENMFNQLSRVAVLSKAGIPDEYLMPMFKSALYPEEEDPYESKMKELSLMEQVLGIGNMMSETGSNEDEINQFFTQYGIGSSGPKQDLPSTFTPENYPGGMEQYLLAKAIGFNTDVPEGYEDYLNFKPVGRYSAFNPSEYEAGINNELTAKFGDKVNQYNNYRKYLDYVE